MIKRINVLVVDDSDVDAFTVGACLDGCPHVEDHMRAHDGDEALDIVQSGRFIPNLILLDLNMPNKDGFSFLKELQVDKNNKRIPVAILSTSARGLDFHRANVRRVPTYIVKPSRMSDLRKSLHGVCENVCLRRPPGHGLVRDVRSTAA